MRAADRSAQSRTGRVLTGPRARIAAVAAGLGLLLLQPGVPGADPTLFTVTPVGDYADLTVGEQMTLEANLPPGDPAVDTSRYRYEWDLDAADGDPTPDEIGDVVTADVEPDDGAGPPFHQTVRLRVIDPGDVTLGTTDQVVHDSGPEALSVGYAPEVGFDMEPTSGSLRAGQTVTFTSTATDQDDDLDESSLRWYVDGQEAQDARGQETMTRSFPAFGVYEVEHEVKDAKGRKQSSKQTVSVAASPPEARFVFSPAEPTTDDTVEFDARSSSDADDPDGSELQFAWDVDDDGDFDDGEEPTLSRRFSEAGEYTVRLRVSDGSSADEKTETFTVRAAPARPEPNVAPKASFAFSPREPEVGQTVTLASTATDSDGRIARVQWDVDNDGRFADGSALTSTSFSKDGNHVVAMKVFDDDGASATAFETITVKPKVPPPPPQNKPLNPFPIIRIRGVILTRGVRVQILSVRTEPNVRVSVRCRGRGCPAKSYSTVLRRSAMRIKKFERMLRAGVVLEVRVSKRGRIGKYTKFTIRRRAAPRRQDLCVGPVSSRPVKCEG